MRRVILGLILLLVAPRAVESREQSQTPPRATPPDPIPGAPLANSLAESPDGLPGALGIKLSLRSPVGIGGVDPDVVYFVRLEAGESLDSALARGEVLATNEADGGRLLILGATPGTYAAVAAAYQKSSSQGPLPIATGHPSRNVSVEIGFDPFASKDVFRTYFSRELIESTLVSVGPDMFAYVGQLTVKQSTGIAKGDEVQRRFQEVLEGSAAKQSGFLRGLTGTYSYRGSLREFQRDAGSEAQFLEKAAKRLRRTEWAALLEKRRAELQAAATTGP